MDEMELAPEQSEPTEEQKQAAEERAQRLDALGNSLAKKRKEAIAARKGSGVEDEWGEDEDAYEGLDEHSDRSKAQWRQRPPGQMPKRDQEPRSRVVLNITKPYVNAAASKLIDMRLAVNGRTWAFKPTPIPELDMAKLEEMKQSEATVDMDGVPVKESALAEATIEKHEKDRLKAEEAAKKGQKRVDDWMVEARFDSEARRVVDDAARLGTGILKGPYPDVVTRKAWKNGQIQVQRQIKPRSRRISAWNLFPDGSCGEDIHAGAYIWERDYITAKGLQALKSDPSYLPGQIDAVLAEGPKASDVERDPNSPVEDPNAKSQPFQIWYYHGVLEKEDIEAAGCTCEDDRHDQPAIITMVNDHVIRAGLNPMDSGSFPYHVMIWGRRDGHWTGIGVAREIRTPQRIITGVVRQMMNNAGQSSGPQIVIKRGVLIPADGQYAITPNKLWYVTGDSDVTDMKQAFAVYHIDSRQQELMNIIQFALKMAEDVTGMPAILQGQQGQAPDVLGVVQILNNNASAIARRVGKMWDDRVIEPHVGAYYDWLLAHGEDDSEKGDFSIDVLTPPDMDVDKQGLKEIMPLVDMPEARVDKAKLFSELSQMNRFDPKRVQYTDEEWEELQKNQQPIVDPRVQVAQMNIAAKQEAMTFEAAEAEKTRMLQAQSDEKDRELDLVLGLMDKELAQMEILGDRTISADELKVRLSETVIKVKAQRDLSAMSAQAKQVATPPTEPAGRAKPGQAYQH
jgi:hypothetical protein